MASGDIVRLGQDTTLASYFGWAGSSFPYCGSAADVTISGATTWNDSCGYKKVGKLTINAGQTLTIANSPFIIFANEIAFGDVSSCIDASGPSGASSGSFTTGMTKGATAVGGSARAQGGCGGGLLFIITSKISGATGVIKANGGNGYRNTTTASAQAGKGGQGAFSETTSENNPQAGVGEKWGGTNTLTATGVEYLNPLGINLAPSYIATTLNASGGGSGQGGTNSAGGSGIGSGGSSGGGTNCTDGVLSYITFTPQMLINMAFASCKGGGAGGANVDNSVGASNGAGGGGGGIILVWVRTLTATPTLQANGGTGAVGTGSANGGAGQTLLISV